MCPPEVADEAEQHARGPRRRVGERRVAPDVVQLVADAPPREQGLGGGAVTVKQPETPKVPSEMSDPPPPGDLLCSSLC